MDASWNRDRGAAVTAGLAVLALHLHDLTTPETFPDSEVESAATRARYLDVALTAYKTLAEHAVAAASHVDWCRKTIAYAPNGKGDAMRDSMTGVARTVCAVAGMLILWLKLDDSGAPRAAAVRA